MILGITGTIGAGKGTIVRHLEKKGFAYFSVSEFLASVAKERGLKTDRVARRKIANEYRKLGPEKLIEAVFKHAKGALKKKKDIVIESLHTPAEVSYIQKAGGKVISVDADIQTRYARAQRRGSPKDNVDYKEFVREQNREMASKNPHENNLATAIAAADFHLENNGSMHELFEEVDDILKEIQ